MSRTTTFLIALTFRIAATDMGSCAPISGLTSDETSRLKNVVVVENVALVNLFEMVTAFGFSEGQRLAFTGAFSRQDWSFEMSGNYLAMPVSLSSAGIFDETSNTGTLAVTGTVGGFSWNGAGSWSFTDVDSETLSVQLDADAAIAGQQDQPDEHSRDGMACRSDGDFLRCFKFHEVRHTKGGRRAGFTSSGYTNVIDLRVPSRDGSAFANFGNEVLLEVNFALGSGSVSGSLQTVPEPSSFVCSLMGVAVTVAVGWRRWRGRGEVRN